MSEKKTLRLDENGEPYGICPECHKKIHHLVFTDDVYITYDATPDNRGELIFDEIDRDSNFDWNIEFRCPECNGTIATSEEEAENFFYEPAQEQDKKKEQDISPASDNTR